MSPAEVDAFLAEQRTCRVATLGPDGPHATPLWYCWDGRCLWLYSIIRSRRWAELRADPRAGVVVDDGREYLELRGVELTGVAEVVGDVPRTGSPRPELAVVERLFAAKYLGAEQMYHDGRHGWLRVMPATLVSWDFGKLAQL
ncbi:MAG: pyridoxamine 5'-phosphate oxidase family protein [Jatrophihabitantaceae bacterium]